MNNDFRVPPLTPSSLTPQNILAERLKPLLGAEFRLTLFPYFVQEVDLVITSRM